MIKCNGVREELLPPEGVGSKLRKNPFILNNNLLSSSKEKNVSCFDKDKSKGENQPVVTNDVGLSCVKRPNDHSCETESGSGISRPGILRNTIFRVGSDDSSKCSQESLNSLGSPEVLRNQNLSNIASNTNHSFPEDTDIKDSSMTRNASPPCFPRILSHPCIAEEADNQPSGTMDSDTEAVSMASTPTSKPPVPAAMLRKQRVGLHRSHTWTACDVPFDRQFGGSKRKSDSLRQGLLTRRHKHSMSLQNVFCMVKETSINSVKTLIKLFEMNVVRFLSFKHRI